MDWNNFWRESYPRENVNQDLDSIRNIHVYYENWVKKIGSKHIEFQKLFENVMIRSTSEAQCESIGSIMNQHCGKNPHLEPEYFSMELVLRVNVGPLNELKGLINEVLASDPDRSYLRKAASKDVYKSAAIATFQTNNENKSCFPKSFWSEN